MPKVSKARLPAGHEKPVRPADSLHYLARITRSLPCELVQTAEHGAAGPASTTLPSTSTSTLRCPQSWLPGQQ